MKRTITFLWLCLCVWMAGAENYPYRNDVLWITVPDHADWIYKTNEKAKVELQLYRYGIPQDGLTVVYELADDMMPAYKKDSVVLKNGKAVISLESMKTPGFRDCKLTTCIDRTVYSHHVKVAFSPEKLKPYTQMPSDFSDFWTNAIKQSEKYPLTYTMEKVEEFSTESVECFLVQLMLNKKGQSVFGYLYIPCGAKPASTPVVFIPPGAGIKTIKNHVPKTQDDKDVICFYIDIHGLNPELPQEVFDQMTKAFNGKENGYLTNGLDNRDNYYMKRVYLACVRSIDFLTSLPQWDGKNVVVRGASQGGALALVTTALHPKVTACVALHPALSDMAGYKAGRAGGYPHFFRTEGMDTPEKLNTMAYYDVVNFARLIQVPVYMTWGFNDNVCPPTTSYIVYNTLNCPKEALITPINEHWASVDTHKKIWRWIKNHLK